MRRRSAALGLLGMLMALEAAGADLLVRRTGSRETGSLQACVGDRCQWNGGPVARAEIAWIGLDASEEDGPPAPSDAGRDELRLRDGGSRSGEVLGISLGSVVLVADGEQVELDRAAVRWVYFGGPAVTATAARETAPTGDAPPPPASPAPRPDATAPPPRTPSGSTGGGAVAEPSTEQHAPLLLNEVGFLPAEGQAPFVELRNAGGEPLSLEGATLRNEKGRTVSLPKGTTIPPGAMLLLLLDGGTGTDAAGVHLPIADFLGRESGVVAIVSPEHGTDGIAWGEGRRWAVDLCRGGRCAEPVAGESLARLPGSARPWSTTDWAWLESEQATPGAANPRPRVAALVGVPGMIFAERPTLSWYGVPGATGYRLEIASDATFAPPLSSQDVGASPGAGMHQEIVTGPELAPGIYFWRVHAIGGDGAVSPPSRAVELEIDPAIGRTRSFADSRPTSPGPGRASGDGDPIGSDVDLDPMVVWHELEIPIFGQRKDTRLLMLEPVSEENPRGWDSPDPDSGRPYCVRAAIADVVAFYEGKLSQDRIGFQAFEDRAGGPELDLPETGIHDSVTTKVLEWALGSAPTYRSNTARREGAEGCRDYPRVRESDPPCPDEVLNAYGHRVIREIKQEIDAGRPILATSTSHLFLIGGYGEWRGRFVWLYMDSALGRVPVRATGASITDNPFTSYWTGLAAVAVRSDEPEVHSDRDGDGVMDFDEHRRRFGTDPDDRDSDDDGVEDKAEIRHSVFDPRFGYGRRPPAYDRQGGVEIEEIEASVDRAGRDGDRDGRAMERDPDSDGGGCKDGEEDVDADGRTGPSETSVFVAGDDPSNEDGCGLWTGTSRGRYLIRNEDGWSEHVVEADWKLRETAWQPLHDATGARVGSEVKLECAGTTLRELWRQEYWSTSGTAWRCTCSGQGETTVTSGPPIDGYILRKSGDAALPAQYGFDLPRGGSDYSFTCAPDPGLEFPLTCSCTGDAPYASDADFSSPPGAGLGRTSEPRCNHDDQARSLEGGGTRMSGTYSVDFPSCGRADSTWSLCKAGTACAAPAPLPGGDPTAPSP